MLDKNARKLYNQLQYCVTAFRKGNKSMSPEANMNN